MFVNKATEMIHICESENISIAEYTIREEMKENGVTREK